MLRYGIGGVIVGLVLTAGVTWVIVAVVLTAWAKWASRPPRSGEAQGSAIPGALVTIGSVLVVAIAAIFAIAVIVWLL
jgi:hypothetical protein